MSNDKFLLPDSYKGNLLFDILLPVTLCLYNLNLFDHLCIISGLAIYLPTLCIINGWSEENKHEKSSRSPGPVCKLCAPKRHMAIVVAKTKLNNIVHFVYSVHLVNCLYCTADQYLAPGWPQKRFC